MDAGSLRKLTGWDPLNSVSLTAASWSSHAAWKTMMSFMPLKRSKYSGNSAPLGLSLLDLSRIHPSGKFRNISVSGYSSRTTCLDSTQVAEATWRVANDALSSCKRRFCSCPEKLPDGSRNNWSAGRR